MYKAVATVTPGWQITLPEAVREHLGLRPGDKLDFLFQDNGPITVHRVNSANSSLKGIVSRPAKAISLSDMEAAVRKRSRGRR